METASAVSSASRSGDVPASNLLPLPERDLIEDGQIKKTWMLDVGNTRVLNRRGDVIHETLYRYEPGTGKDKGKVRVSVQENEYDARGTPIKNGPWEMGKWERRGKETLASMKRGNAFSMIAGPMVQVPNPAPSLSQSARLFGEGRASGKSAEVK